MKRSDTPIITFVVSMKNYITFIQEYRQECQRKCLHKPMNAIMDQLFANPSGEQGTSVNGLLVPLLRAVANLAYDTVHIQADLQHHAPSLAALITNGTFTTHVHGQ